MEVYLANGLFSLADFNLNKMLAKEIRNSIKGINLYVPQEEEINDKNSYADSKKIFELDFAHLSTADLGVAVIDGVEIDSGVACEIGIAKALGIPIIGLYTDVRQLGTENNKKIKALIEDSVENQFMYRNLFVTGAIKSNGLIVNNVEDLIEKIKEFFR